MIVKKSNNNITTEDLDSFFENGLYNECQAVEELLRSIEESQNEPLARRALNLFQKHYTTLDRPWDHETFMYGLGLIYMHFNAYSWAVKSFRETVYVQPGYLRSRDIHARLGLIFKTTGRYKLSEKHFNLAINDTRLDSGTSTKLELKFHLAHLSEIQGKTKQAIESYEKLLQERELPPKLSANIQRQLGWIHYSTATKSGSQSKNNNESRLKHTDLRKLDAALNYLNTSYKADSDSQTSYCLGRCLTNVGKFQDAFAFYRSVIDREESTADTWCSIGVLYQRQNQPLDALQAYIRSVQYDKKHAVAWMNLGILYESHNQFKDALKCYKHVLRSCPKGESDNSLQDRIIYIQKHINDIETASSSNSAKSEPNSDKLLSLEDLWNMESKTNQESSTSNSNSNNSEPKQIEKSNNNQMQWPNAKTEVKCHMLSGTDIKCNGKLNDDVNQFLSNTIKNENNASNNGCKVGTTLFVADSKTTPKLQSEPNQVTPATCNINGLSTNHISDEAMKQVSHDFKPQSLDSKEFCINQMFTNGTSKDSGISSDSSTYTDCALVPSQNTDFSTTSYMSAEQVIGACRKSTKVKKIDINLLSDDSKPPLAFPRPSSYPPLPSHKLFPFPPSIFLDSKKELTSKKLQDICQSNPISIVRNLATVLKLDLGLFSTKTLVESNPDQMIDIMSHQFYQSIDGTNDETTTNNNSWKCERHRSFSTISNYASYQVDSFKQSIQEERDNKTKSNMTKESETDSNESAIARKNSDCPISSKHNESPSFKGSGPTIKKLKTKDETRTKIVKSADVIDLSDDKKWRPQLNELNKLPHFLRCVSASNMLTHIGAAVPGLNTVTMSMHVPGCKIVGNRTPNNFCPIHINIGPGDYEWSAIPAEYERILKKLCNRNGFEFNEKDWWPRLDDLQRYHIPVYRFSQRPGDLVWVNSGTFYWVQATGWANSIHWNVGPLCARQYRLASESCELDKFLFRKSEVPMAQMTWNIVMNINIINDDELFQLMINVMRRSLRYCQLVIDIVDGLKLDIDISDEEPGPRSAKFCSLCECEVFNVTFTRRQDDAIHCIECARRADATFKEYRIDQIYDLSYLMQLYDGFIETKKKFQARQQQRRPQQQA